MSEINDEQMRETVAYGFFFSDKITGSELAGSNAFSTPFTFYRVGFDGQLAVNVNMSKLQLGCGGVNDLLNPVAGCDIDVDYVSMLGRNGNTVGNPLSAVTLERPYFEFAIKNDGSASREFAGWKIGAQSVNGAMVVGRRYETNGSANQENSLIWHQWPMQAQYWDDEPYRENTGNCNTGAAVNTAPCHSGANTLSGFLGAELSLTMYVHACAIACWIPLAEINEWGCAGRTTNGSDTADCDDVKSDALFVELGGTRMQYMGLRDAQLFMTPNALLDLLGGDAYTSMNADLRLLHFLTFNNTGDFFISFQREPIAYPRYSKMTPKAEFAALNPNYYLDSVEDYIAGDEMFIDACATTRWDSARCDSAYSVPANTGWWLNAPTVKLLNIRNDYVDLGTVSLAQALEMLDHPGLLLSDPNFNMTPFKNCYGASRFC